jgi:hypothetical protein
MQPKPLKRCANGCPCAPSPPSLVICRACQKRITAKLEHLADGRRLADFDPPPGKEES